MIPVDPVAKLRDPQARVFEQCIGHLPGDHDGAGSVPGHLVLVSGDGHPAPQIFDDRVGVVDGRGPGQYFEEVDVLAVGDLKDGDRTKFQNFGRFVK